MSTGKDQLLRIVRWGRNHATLFLLVAAGVCAVAVGARLVSGGGRREGTARSSALGGGAASAESEKSVGPVAAPDERHGAENVLYVLVSNDSCECFVDLCEEVRRTCEKLVDEHGNRVQIRVLDKDDDEAEVERIRNEHGLTMLPIVALVVRDGEYEDVLYKADPVTDAEGLMWELKSWIEGLSVE